MFNVQQRFKKLLFLLLKVIVIMNEIMNESYQIQMYLGGMLILLGIKLNKVMFFDLYFYVYLKRRVFMVLKLEFQNICAYFNEMC